LTRGK